MTAYTIEQMLPDIPRLYTALAEWLACVVCIAEQRQRFEKWKVCGILGLALPVQTVFLVLTKGKSGFLWFLYGGCPVFYVFADLGMYGQQCARCGISLYPGVCYGGVCCVAGMAAVLLRLL